MDLHAVMCLVYRRLSAADGKDDCLRCPSTGDHLEAYRKDIEALVFDQREKQWEELFEKIATAVMLEEERIHEARLKAAHEEREEEEERARELANPKRSKVERADEKRDDMYSATQRTPPSGTLADPEN